MLLLAARTRYREPPIPGILFESQSRLQQRCFPDFPERLASLIKGAYAPADKIIYLDNAFDRDDPVDRSYLLHELVHHFQVHEPEDPGVRPGVSSRGKPTGCSCAGSGKRESRIPWGHWDSMKRPCASSSTAFTSPRPGGKPQGLSARRGADP